eukprot:10199231-Lingulodinium_polyedra.AAC.1
MGREVGGAFATAKLKEYPPALNRALAATFAAALESAPVGPPVPDEAQAPFLEVLALVRPVAMGADYAPLKQLTELEVLRAEAKRFASSPG